MTSLAYTPSRKQPEGTPYQPKTADDLAFRRRRAHANIEAMTGRILQAVGYPTRRHRDFICALQSSNSGDAAKVPFTPFRRAHLTLAQFMEVSGSEENRRKFIYREICTLRRFTKQTGLLLIHVTPGSEEAATEYIDFLTPAADAAMQSALTSPLWKTNKAQAISEAVAWAVEQLPRVDVVPEVERETAPRPLSAFATSREQRYLASIERDADEIEKRGGDDTFWIKRLATKLKNMAASRRKTARARGVTVFPNLEATAEADGKETTWDKTDPPAPASPEGGGRTDLSAPPEETANENAAFNLKRLPLFTSKLDAALAYARTGWYVLPLHTPKPDGGCSCHKASCPHAGKHPRTLNGVKDATRDEATIRRWWGRWPEANVGVATGAASGIVALDSDPRHGGDVSLSALIEKYGDWPRTPEQKTGGGGDHIIFEHPGVAFKNSASVLGEGLDIKTDGGYVVAAPSKHASGGDYRWSQLTKPAPMPEWMVAELTKPQPPRARPSGESSQPLVFTADGPPILDGNRNEKLFKICCALRGQGAAQDQLIPAAHEINRARCKDRWGREPFPLEDDEVAKIVGSALRYDPNPVAESAVRS